MNDTILQVPIDKKVRDRAVANAREMGFSSLQEVVRLFLNKVAEGAVNVAFERKVRLSPKAEKRYNKMIEEIESGTVKPKTFTNVDDLMKHLNEG